MLSCSNWGLAVHLRSKPVDLEGVDKGEKKKRKKRCSKGVRKKGKNEKIFTFESNTQETG